MMMRQVLGAACALVFVAGCSTPTIKGDSLQNQKQLSFPKAGTQSTATVGSVAALYSNYQSRTMYQLEQPFHLKLLFAHRIEVPADEQLFQAELEGETVYCTVGRAYHDMLAGPMSPACFKVTSPGKFGAVKWLPGAVWGTKEISPEIGFTSREIQAQGQSTPLKRELVYDGNGGGTLMFTERIYEKSLQTPSRIKPLMASVTTVPAKINLDGMDINVIRVDGKSLTFEVITPWQ